MNDRTQILSRLHQLERDAAHPPTWRSRRHFDDLAGCFSQSLTAAKGEVRRAANLEEALDQLGDILHELQPQRVAVNAEPPLTSVDLPARWPRIQWHVVGRSVDELQTSMAGLGQETGPSNPRSSREYLRAFCASADAGISSADVALAETGSIVISSGPGKSRLVTLLPPVHIALVPTSCLTTDLFTWTAGRSGKLPASVTLVSGPSKSADIEQTLAVGVHGPKRLIVVLYGD